MAVEAVKKITIIVHRSLQEEVLATLARAGTVQVECIEADERLRARELSEQESSALRRYNLEISQVEFLLGFLAEHSEEKKGFFATLIRPKFPMTVDEFLTAEGRVNLERVYRECSGLEQRLLTMREDSARLEAQAEELENWEALEVPMRDLCRKEVFCVAPLRVLKSELDMMAEELDGSVGECGLEVQNEKGPWLNCLLFYHPDYEEQVQGLLGRFPVEVVTLPHSELEPAEMLEQVRREITAIERASEEVLRRVAEHQRYVGDLTVLKELLVNRRNHLEARASLGETDSTVVIDGWVTEKSVEPTMARLGALSEEMAVEVREPQEGEPQPVSLANRSWCRPFELLTLLYGVPNRREYDPTPIVAVSFVIFFGLCIGDVGYGLVLAVAFLLMRKYLPVGDNVKNLMMVLFYGSILAMAVGVIMGSWFGIATDSLPQALKTLAIFDPLESPIPVMLLCMALGLSHMIAGTAVEFRDNWRHGARAAALIDQGLVFLFFICLGLAVPLVLMEVVPTTVAMLIALAPVLAMFLLLGREAKSIPGKAVSGLYETYNVVVGWMGDTISYLRLYALGLATFVIGWVVNTLAGMLGGVAPVIGLVLMVLILIIGHTFNVTVNLLGAFVHPLRLEFVEFFSKFYEDGGGKFSPLKFESKIVLFDEESGA